jgi:hypothetical protein
MGKVRDYFENVVMTYNGDECLLWPYGKGRGYGLIRDNGHLRVAANLLCERVHGLPPPNYETRHLCNNGKHGCVTKKHVVWSDHITNMADQVAFGTRNRGQRNGRWQLITEDDVRAIRESSDKQRVIAKKFGIAQQHVSDIKCRKKWAHVPD